ncbi:hypothetical protein CVT26_012990 [Gymnopilus dilepis]|uniref:MYND-type domain-containing protein n=1 Tax=Gymnopilus dilepis TaxID=231916 RepID=A0A409YPA1_9AGAR|nr:hypothetical protein CVT26_012990 [Gymnopilus dilepis]
MTCQLSGNGKSSPHQVDAEASTRASEFFAIREPHNPRYCGTCLLGAFITCTPAERPTQCCCTDTNAQASTVTHPKVWKAVMAFLTHKRTDTQMDRLLVRLSTCNCRMDQQGGYVKAYHDAGKHHGEVFILRMRRIDELTSGLDEEAREKRIITVFWGRVLISELFGVLIKAIERRGLKSVAKGISKAWPFNPTDLIPNGADSLAEMILQWYRWISDPVIFVATGYILRICQELFFPSLVKCKFSFTFLEACRRLVDLTMVDFSTADDDAHACAAQRFQFFATSWVPLFKIFLGMSKQNSGAAAKPKPCKYAPSLDLLNLNLSSDPRLPPHGVDHWVDSLATHGCRLFRLFRMYLHPRPDMPVHPKVEEIDSKTFPPPASIRSPKQMMLTAILDFRTETRCSAYRCRNALQNVGGNFERCSRCTIVTYCGRDCQAKAWKDEQHTHKRICPLLRLLVEIGGGPQEVFRGHGNWNNIIDRWNASAVDEEQFQLVWDWYKLVTDARGYPMPDGTEWTPGYEDYNEIISQLSADGLGPPAKYLNRLARWPCEIAKVVAHLKVLPFWGEELDW